MSILNFFCISKELDRGSVCQILTLVLLVYSLLNGGHN